MEIIGQFVQAAGEVGIGNLGDAKLAHAIFLLLPSYRLTNAEMVTLSIIVMPSESGASGTRGILDQVWMYFQFWIIRVRG